MLIWPKHVVVGMCCMISCDGSIKHHKTKEATKRKHGVSESNQISICYSSEKEWLKQIQKVLRKHKIGTSITGPYSSDKIRLPPEYKAKAKGQYGLMLNKKYPKRRRGGLDQHQIFRNSIEHWGIQDYLMERKYQNLCKITEPMPLVDNAKMQTSIF